MWQLFVFLFGFIFSSASSHGINRNMVTTAGEDVNLKCPWNGTIDSLISITWRQSDGSTFFHCDSVTKPCEINTTTHTLGINITIISSNVMIRNVSLANEDEYDILIILLDKRETCKINLTVNVPPKGLILVNTTGDTCVHDQGSLTVAEGENKTLVCKTNTSVKPGVNLEWVYPIKLNASVEPQENMYDKHDGRLLVPTRTIHFTPTYGNTENIVLICEVASNSTLNRIQKSVLIINEGERTTNSKTTGTGSKHAMTTSNGHSQDSGTSCIPTVGPSTSGNGNQPWYKQIYLVIPGCFGVVMLLIVLAFVGGFIRSKRRDVRRSVNAGSTELRQPQGRRSLPPTPSDQSSLPANHLPDQPPPTARLPRPVPSIPSYNPMRPLVPVSEDGIRSPAEITGSRMTGETKTDSRTPVTQAQKAEYAIVSRQQVDKRIDQRQLQRSKQMDDDSDYDLLNTWNQAEHGTVPHVYKETTSGLAEYAVVSKPDAKKKRHSLGPLTKVMKAPINVEAEYAVVDKWKKRAK